MILSYNAEFRTSFLFTTKLTNVGRNIAIYCTYYVVNDRAGPAANKTQVAAFHASFQPFLKTFLYQTAYCS